MLYILNHILIKHKNIFEYFSCFWKVFCFENFQRIQKFLQLYFGDLLAGQATCKLSLKLLRLSGESVHQSRKILRKYFKISGFLAFSLLSLVTCSQVKAPVMILHRRIRDSPRNLIVSGPSNREKHLEKIFKILFKGFWQLILATCSRVNPVTKILFFA